LKKRRTSMPVGQDSAAISKSKAIFMLEAETSTVT